MLNYFSPKTAAERYAKGRPYFHPNTIQHIKNYFKLNGKLDKALDVACGTGLSTKALLAIAENVYGADVAQEMLNWTEVTDKINYIVAPAEELPFSDFEFDLITVGSGVHWFNIDKFLAEAHRILKPNAWLVLYENYFVSHIEGVEHFKEWYPNVFLNKFSVPPRNNRFEWSAENIKPYNFGLRYEERFANNVPLTLQQLVLYLTTQSNIIAAVESGATTYEEVETWLAEQLTPFFGDEATRNVQYGNWVRYIQREQ